MRRRLPRRRMQDRKSTRLNSSHTVIYTLSLHDALPIFPAETVDDALVADRYRRRIFLEQRVNAPSASPPAHARSEEHTSELQSHRDLHSFPTRRSSDLPSRDGR